MNILRRVAVGGAATLCALGLAAGSASASTATTQTQAQGTFFYTDLLGGAGQITRPVLGVCYPLTSLALTGSNQTNAVATTYSDANCLLLGQQASPGNNPTFPFSSVRFTAVP